jgi:beta-fructofuranosidase
MDDGSDNFDGIVFGEICPRRWMAGSEVFSRTETEQEQWPEASTRADEFVQMAISYRGQEITLSRDGELYARYTADGAARQFGPQSVVMFGRRHLAAGDKDASFEGRILDARVYDRALGADALKGLVPGDAGQGPPPWAWWDFARSGLRERTGRFTVIRLIGEARVEEGCLVLPGKGATAVFGRSADDSGDAGGLAGIPGVWALDGPVPEAVVASSRMLRERMLADPYRPGYHFCVPEDQGMPGDPNGAFYHNGRYHLMYLYSRTGSGFCWGHVSSKDLLHWRHHPDAIGPGDGDEGCFSGGAFVDQDGSVWLSYWMLWGAKGIGLARSTDANHDVWEKASANPVIQSTEWGVTEVTRPDGTTFCYGSADPSNIWREKGRYYMLTGSLLTLEKLGRAPDAPIDEQGDRLYLHVSDDLENWEYLHVFYQRRPEWTDRSEDNMCPSFFPLPASRDGGEPTDKHLLLFISHNRGCQFYIGDYRDDHFYPETHGRMSWVDNTYFAPEALMDDRGRQIMWAWLTDNPPGDPQRGWSGVYSLPRTLWLGDDGTLRMAPVPELEALRDREQTWSGITVADGAPHRLEGVVGDSCELRLTVDCGSATRCGVRVRTSEGGEEQTLLYYDAETRELVFDSTRNGLLPRAGLERAPFALESGERLELRVFVDKPVVEVFANHRQAICRRVYPQRDDSLGVVLFAEGGEATFEKVTAWRMMPSQPW